MNPAHQPIPMALPSRAARAAALAAVLVAVVLLASACGSSGRELTPPIGGAVSPTRSTAPDPAATTGPFELTSTAFVSGEPIPAELVCADVSPALAWTGAKPAGTVELALVARDATSDTVLWFVASIGTSVSSSPQGGTPENVAQLTNSLGVARYSPPCPPAGETHTYEFTVYALSAPAAIPMETPAKDALRDIQPKVLGSAVLTGTAAGAGAETTATSTADSTATTATTVP